MANFAKKANDSLNYLINSIFGFGKAKDSSAQEESKKNEEKEEKKPEVIGLLREVRSPLAVLHRWHRTDPDNGVWHHILLLLHDKR